MVIVEIISILCGIIITMIPSCSSVPASTARDQAIIEELNSIVEESAKIKDVSEAVTELCSQRTLKRVCVPE